MTFPCDLLRLTSSEHLLLWCLRTVVQRGEDAEIHEGIVGAFEGEGEETARAVYRFLFLLGLGARRPIVMEAPGCLRVTGDERRLLAILALAQSGAEAPAEEIPDEAALTAHLSWFVRAAVNGTVAAATRSLARAMLAQDHRLPLPAPAPTPGPEAAGRPRLRLVASSPAAPSVPHPEPLMRSAMPWPEIAR
ncbi:hypothetical protein RQ831_00205 [Roseomonas gilardii]|uniref:Uncharacterized protein n=1 Tax=Roseomonas gilardii TaxID=257708 RepID=A0A1L7ACY7_9PROT|nr:hypothetical protein [Roseomonas gilardii]APT56654.1 hypothetical protein RGI145_05575 [Roseomonas gilardii]MDT8329451.1 hypothetical protein [Roseomonas gilardii]